MLPLGETLYLWRAEKGLTQTQLSCLTGVSRPNLSAIEQGARDVTVQTLRRIAKALAIGPGFLIEGVPPRYLKKPLKQTQLVKIAKWLVLKSGKLSPDERTIAEIFEKLIHAKLSMHKSKPKYTPVSSRVLGTCWLKLKVILKQTEIDYILRKVAALV